MVQKMKSFDMSLKGALLASTVLALPTAAIAQETQDSGIEEVVVQGQYIPDEKRATSEISNILDAEAFARTGDSDVAVALTRVTGLSVVGGKYVYVRGLGERYSLAQLDGSTLPPLSPLRRDVPLDIFPTAMVGSVLVQKTFSPEYPLDFGGGVVDMRTKAVPDEQILEIGIGTKVNTESTFKGGLSYDGPNSEFFGFGGKMRDLPAALAANPTLEGMTAEERNAAAEALPNKWSIDAEDNLPAAKVDFTYGDRFESGDNAYGFLISGNYENEWDNEFGERNTYATSNAGLVPRDEVNAEACAKYESGDANDCGRRVTNQNISLNGILTVGAELGPDHALKATSVILRKSTKRASIEKGSFASDPGSIRTNSETWWEEREVWWNQVSGEHHFSHDSDTFQETQVNWLANYTRSTRDLPFWREFTYDFDENEQADLLSPRTDGNRTSYGALKSETWSGGVDILQPVTLGDTPVDFKLGAHMSDQDYTSSMLRYGFVFPAGANIELRKLVPEIVFGPVNLDPAGITLAEYTDPSDEFTGNQKITSLYAGIDAQLSDVLRIAVGGRYEKSEQDLLTFIRVTGEPDPVSRSEEDFLPAATLTWEFAENLQLRLAYSQTVNRPTLRELSRATFVNERGENVRGNPDLLTADIDNYDARIEWYFGAADFASVGVFYKDFTNPIEESYTILGEGPLKSLQNAAGAKLKGAEAELQINLPVREAFGWDFVGDREFFFNGNISYIDSEVDLTGQDTQATTLVRPLQGTSKWLGNASIGWEEFETGERVSLVLNYQGKRIDGTGLFGAPDVYENPPILLNFVYKRNVDVFGGPLEVSFKAENLLNDDYRRTQGEGIFEQYDLGRAFSLGFKYSF